MRMFGGHGCLDDIPQWQSSRYGFYVKPLFTKGIVANKCDSRLQAFVTSNPYKTAFSAKSYEGKNHEN